MGKVTMSAYATDYNEKCYKLHYGKNNFEFIPKSQCELVEAPNGIDNKEPQSCYFELPMWLAKKLKGIDYYGI